MKTRYPGSIKITIIFIFIHAFIWLMLGILIAANYHMSLPDIPAIKAVMAILSFALACMLFGLAFFIQKYNRYAYYLTLLIFSGAALLTIFDDFGIADLVVLILNIIPICLLIKDRKWYLQALAPASAAYDSRARDGDR
jgi:hypothetical protein